MRPDTPRPLIVGPENPSPPFPLRLSGPIVKGFGRGSSELGIPTANIPIAGLSVGGNEDVESGVYYGWAGVDVDEDGKRCGNGDGETEGKREGQGEGKAKAKGNVWPMVMSIGWNPYYKNTKRSVEVHILHHFPHDFYGAQMNLLICGFIRPEYDYVSKESLIEDIRTDIEVARKSLERESYRELRKETWLMEFQGVGEEAS